MVSVNSQVKTCENRRVDIPVIKIEGFTENYTLPGSAYVITVSDL